MFTEDEWLIIGEIVAAQGLKGELRINPKTDFPERFTNPGQRWLLKKGQDPQAIELIQGRKLAGKSIYVIILAGINSRNAAEGLIGQSLIVPAKERPKLSEGEFHLLDLVGLEIKLRRQDPAIGTVIDLITAGNDLLEVKLSKGKTVLIPFVKEIVPEVNLKEGWLLINPPKGLLDL